jgi:hypothetical protein
LSTGSATSFAESPLRRHFFCVRQGGGETKSSLSFSVTSTRTCPPCRVRLTTAFHASNMARISFATAPRINGSNRPSLVSEIRTSQKSANFRAISGKSSFAKLGCPFSLLHLYQPCQVSSRLLRISSSRPCLTSHVTCPRRCS